MVATATSVLGPANNAPLMSRPQPCAHSIARIRRTAHTAHMPGWGPRGAVGWDMGGSYRSASPRAATSTPGASSSSLTESSVGASPLRRARTAQSVSDWPKGRERGQNAAEGSLAFRVGLRGQCRERAHQRSRDTCPMSLGARIPARYGRGALPHERRPSLGAWGGHLRRRRRRAPKSPDPRNLLLPQQLHVDMLS